MFNSVTIKQAIEDSGVISINPKGTSMYPYLKHTDTVILKKWDGPVKKYDCILFFGRENTYVLHRLMRIDGELLYPLGDNNVNYDKPIKREDVVGVLEGFYRKGKYHAVHSKKISLRVKLGCFAPIKKMRLFCFRVIRKLKKIFGKNKEKSV